MFPEREKGGRGNLRHKKAPASAGACVNSSISRRNPDQKDQERETGKAEQVKD